MKKIIIILAVILTSALTALSLTRRETKPQDMKASFEKANAANSNGVAGRSEKLSNAD